MYNNIGFRRFLKTNFCINSLHTNHKYLTSYFIISYFFLSSVSPAPGYMYCHRRLGHKYTSEHMEGVKEVSADMLFLMIDYSVKLKFC